MTISSVSLCTVKTAFCLCVLQQMKGITMSRNKIISSNAMLTRTFWKEAKISVQEVEYAVSPAPLVVSAPLSRRTYTFKITAFHSSFLILVKDKRQASQFCLLTENLTRWKDD